MPTEKNTASAVTQTIEEGFWGIEADVHQNKDNFRIYHDEEHETYSVAKYNLDEFLDTCKANNITAILDLKKINDYQLLISLVKEKEMASGTIYQTSIKLANKIHQVDKNARIWVLMDTGSKNTPTNEIINRLTSCKDYIEGVNMNAMHIDEKDINIIQELGLTICSFSYRNKLYHNADAKTLKLWGTNYLMANHIDEQIN